MSFAAGGAAGGLATGTDLAPLWWLWQQAAGTGLLPLEVLASETPLLVKLVVLEILPFEPQFWEMFSGHLLLEVVLDSCGCLRNLELSAVRSAVEA